MMLRLVLMHTYLASAGGDKTIRCVSGQITPPEEAEPPQLPKTLTPPHEQKDGVTISTQDTSIPGKNVNFNVKELLGKQQTWSSCWADTTFL